MKKRPVFLRKKILVVKREKILYNKENLAA